jgi:predicted dehydrogenase
MRNKLDLGGGALPDIGVYPTETTRIATGREPVRVQATIERDTKFGTDIYSSIRADFGDFELSFYLSTQMAARQTMVFHGEEGFIEVFARAALGGRDKVFTLEESVLNQKVIDAIFRAGEHDGWEAV